LEGPGGMIDKREILEATSSFSLGLPSVGLILTISISADGEYRFDESSSHTIRCDGEKGAKTRATHDELSTDGKTFATTVTEFRPDQPIGNDRTLVCVTKGGKALDIIARNGPPVTSQIVFSRLSGSNDFAGQWRDTNYLQQHAEMTLRLDNRTLHIDYPKCRPAHRRAD
jgi:hypothetical protein